MPDTATTLVTLPHRVDLATAYYQYDQQGVVFSMWYLAFLEEARNSYLASCGYPLATLLEDGFDIQVVHAALNWSGPVRYGDRPLADVGTRRVGTTSLALNFSISVESRLVLVAEVAYVIVDAATGSKASLPAALRAGLSQQDGVSECPVPAAGAGLRGSGDASPVA